VDTLPLCTSCRFNELRNYLIVGKPAESRGCWHHISIFPKATTCPRYERAPGTDDA
jgi:hypothetical protein